MPPKSNTTNKNKNQEIAKNIWQLMTRHNNISQVELAAKTGIPTPTLNKILLGHTTDPRISTLKILADFFNTSVDQILSEESPINLIDEKQSIPILTWEEAIQFKSILSKATPNNWEKWITVDGSISGNGFALVTKPSMSPRFPKGTVLIANPKQRPKDGNLVIAVYPNTNEATLREILIDGPNNLLLPITDGTQSTQLNENIKIIATVIQSRFIYN